MRHVAGLFLALLVYGGALAAAEPWWSEHYIISRVKTEDGHYSWIRHGLLFCRVYPIGPKKSEYLYCGKDDVLEEVTDNSKISGIIREELPEGQAMPSFLEKVFPEALSGFTRSVPGIPVTDELLGYFRRNDMENWGGLTRAQIDRLLKEMAKYEERQTEIKDGEWKVMFYTTHDDGRVTKWEATGYLRWFTIKDVKTTEVEKPGTFVWPSTALRYGWESKIPQPDTGAKTKGVEEAKSR